MECFLQYMVADGEVASVSVNDESFKTNHPTCLGATGYIIAAAFSGCLIE